MVIVNSYVPLNNNQDYEDKPIEIKINLIVKFSDYFLVYYFLNLVVF